MGNMYPSHLAGGGGGYSGTAQPADVLTGETFINANGPQTGSMTNNAAVSGTATPTQPYTIPEGYHNGNGSVSASIGSVYDAVTITDAVAQSQGQSAQTITCEIGDLLLGLVVGTPSTPTGTDDVTSEYSLTTHGTLPDYKIYKATATSVTFPVQSTGNAYTGIFRITVK